MTTLVAYLTEPRGLWLSRWVEETMSRLTAWNNRRVAAARLHALPDYLLADIGVERGDIEVIVGRVQKDSR